MDSLCSLSIENKMTYRYSLQCQKCSKTIGWGFTSYCNSLELYCWDCGMEIEEKEEKAELN